MQFPFVLYCSRNGLDVCVFLRVYAGLPLPERPNTNNAKPLYSVIFPFIISPILGYIEQAALEMAKVGRPK